MLGAIRAIFIPIFQEGSHCIADRIKGITMEIGGNTTGLSKTLSGVNKEIKNTQTQLTDVNRLLKLDPANSGLLSQNGIQIRRERGYRRIKEDAALIGILPIEWLALLLVQIGSWRSFATSHSTRKVDISFHTLFP
jgi:hypothetical protein